MMAVDARLVWPLNWLPDGDDRICATVEGLQFTAVTITVRQLGVRDPFGHLQFRARIRFIHSEADQIVTGGRTLADCLNEARRVLHDHGRAVMAAVAKGA